MAGLLATRLLEVLLHLAHQLRVLVQELPVRRPDPTDPTRVFRQVSVGGLADLFLLDIRSRRDQPVVGPEMADAGRSMLGAEQRGWLESSLESSTAAWRLVATPSIMIRTWSEDPTPLLRDAMLKLKLMDEDSPGA